MAIYAFRTKHSAMAFFFFFLTVARSKFQKVDISMEAMKVFEQNVLKLTGAAKKSCGSTYIYMRENRAGLAVFVSSLWL